MSNIMCKVVLVFLWCVLVLPCFIVFFLCFSNVFGPVGLPVPRVQVPSKLASVDVRVFHEIIRDNSVGAAELGKLL